MSGDQLNLDEIGPNLDMTEAWWGNCPDIGTVGRRKALALVAEVRRLTAELDSLAETHDHCRDDIAEPGYRAP